MKKVMALILAVSLCIIFAGCGHKHIMAERIITEKTCTVDGLLEHYCTKCDYKYTETIEASHDYEKKVTVESTCIEKGETQFTCKVCGDSYVKEDMVLGDHKYVDKYCTVCGAKKIGKITTPLTSVELNYGAYDVVRSTCRITDVTAEINSYGVMTVYFTGIKTYDMSGDNINGPCSFMMIIKDARGNIVYSDQVMTHCVVNQTFNIYTTPSVFFDESEDYRITLEDYMI